MLIQSIIIITVGKTTICHFNLRTKINNISSNYRKAHCAIFKHKTNAPQRCPNEQKTRCRRSRCQACVRLRQHVHNNIPHPLEQAKPAAVAASPRMQLPMTYKLNAPHRPDVARESASLENVENVVKPPQRPTVSANCRLSLQPNFTPKPQKIPIQKLPTTLTPSVVHGKNETGSSIPTAYRNRLPKPPAKKIKI